MDATVPAGPAPLVPPPNRSRIWTPLFFLLNFLSVIPALIGFLYSAHRFYTTPRLVISSLHWESVGVTYSRSTRLDWFVSGMWALACAYFTHSLARGLLRRWLVYYPLGPTIVRVLSLQAICWPLTLTTHRVLSFDQPVAAWFVCATTAAISNVIQSWVTSNIVERKDRRGQPSWKFVSSAITAVLGPGVRTDKYRKGERVLSWKRVLWGTVLPFAVLGWATTNALLWQQFVARYRGGGGVDLGPPKLNSSISMFPSRLSTLAPLDPTSHVRVLVIVSSSWSDTSRLNRQTFRDTSLRLFPTPSPSVSIAYRFLLGDAPSPQTAGKTGPNLEVEASQYGDLVLLPARDSPEHSSHRAFEGWKWARGFDVDYVLKTDDTVFLRMDVIAKELVQIGKKAEYWRGFAYWGMPVLPHTEAGYDLSQFPPYTDGTLHILSHDLVALIAPPSSPRRLTRHEDQSLGTWLFPTGVRPLHDHRIQLAQVCENDLLAKRFGHEYNAGLSGEPADGRGGRPGARKMFSNIVQGRKPCDGFEQRWCGICYPSCRKRDHHWSDSGFVCDEVKGATVSSNTLPSLYDLAPIKVAPPTRRSVDPWILPGVLSTQSSPLSDTEDWHLLHGLIWTKPPALFGERHFHALETIWVHEPRAAIVVLSTTLDLDFFVSYTEMGYSVHVVRVGKQDLLKREWYVGKETESWIREWDRWSLGPNFDSHLGEYLRYLFLFKFGGTVADFDTIWIRSPPNSDVEFIGTEHSTLAADDSWTLDEEGTYLATKVMRLRRGWSLFHDVLETAFSARYSAECSDCVGPKAVTLAFRPRRRLLESSGLSLLAAHVLYPRPWISSHELVRSLVPPDTAVERLRAMANDDTWSIHLFASMTNHLPVQPGSIAAVAIEKFSLEVPRRRASTSPFETDTGGDALASRSQPPTGLELVYPRMYRRSTARLGRGVSPGDDAESYGSGFTGLDVIYVRSLVSCEPVPSRIRIETLGGGQVSLASSSSRNPARTRLGGGADAVELRFEAARLQDINAALSSVRYLEPADETREADELRISVEMGKEKVEGKTWITLA